jgi:hypothetical protein
LEAGGIDHISLKYADVAGDKMLMLLWIAHQDAHGLAAAPQMSQQMAADISGSTS